MRILPRPIYEQGIEASAPFARDAFHREAIAHNLTRLFSISSDGLVVSIDAKWGEGKTSFLKFWELFLQGHPQFISIYYDAFRNDFTSDAFVSIAAAIHRSLSDRLRKEGNTKATRAQLSHLKKASKELAIDLAKMTAGLAISHISGGLVKSESLTEWMKKAFQRLTFDTLAVNAEEQFEAYTRSQDSVLAYQQTLIELLKPQSSDTDTRVIVFIDELDRCRPVFAVEILEKVKHLFNIPGVFFVLAINKDQLLRTIASVYGISNDDAIVYLQKFVDFETRLPRIAGEADLQTISNYLKGLAAELGISEGPLSILQELDALTTLVSVHLRLSPRAIARATSFMALALGSCDESDALRLKRFIVIAAAIRVGAPEQYERLLRDGTFFDEHRGEVRLFGWAKQYFERELEIKAGNVFAVPQMKEAAWLLDLYEIPTSRERGEPQVRERGEE